MGTYATRALYPNLTRISQLGTYNDKYPPHHRVSMFGVVAGERRVFELRGGAGGVPDPAEPGPGRGDGWVCTGTDAFAWGDLWNCALVSAAGAHADVCQFCGAGGALRGADDCVDGGVAGRG